MDLRQQPAQRPPDVSKRKAGPRIPRLIQIQ